MFVHCCHCLDCQQQTGSAFAVNALIETDRIEMLAGTPVAISMGLQLGVDPRPLVVAVMMGASASFATPIGYQTNTLVYGPGGYRFSDFIRVGLPLNILMAVVASLVIPVFWPLYP